MGAKKMKQVPLGRCLAATSKPSCSFSPSFVKLVYVDTVLTFSYIVVAPSLAWTLLYIFFSNHSCTT
jgi:hypothetical protein